MKFQSPPGKSELDMSIFESARKDMKNMKKKITVTKLNNTKYKIRASWSECLFLSFFIQKNGFFLVSLDC